MKASSSAPVREANQPAPDADDDEGPRIELSRRAIATFGVFVVLAVAALYFLLPKLAGLHDTWHRIEQGSPAWLILAGVFTVGMFGGYVWLFERVFDAARLTWSESYQITMAALAASRLLSAGGAGGLVLQAWALRRAGLPARDVADRTVSFIVLTYLVYTLAIVVVGYGLYFGVLPGAAPWAITFVPATLALVVTVAGLSIAFVPPDLQRRLTRSILARVAGVPATLSAGVRDALLRIRRRDPAILGALLFWGCQIAVLWASFRAFGQAPPVAVLIMGFFVGMLGNLLPLPGGIGGVDGGMIGAFAAFDVDFGLATVAVLTFRGFTFWLPTVPGILAYLQLRRTVDRWRAERRRPAEAAA
ncbi:MAG: putative heme transporter [Solirubrobacteraceae bacterium]|nr:putative heme transporter [Solirubrobacteraceae bacterium]